jgi:hypothetical protein
MVTSKNCFFDIPKTNMSYAQRKTPLFANSFCFREQVMRLMQKVAFRADL